MIPYNKKMALNKFRKVHISRGRDLFARFGEKLSSSVVPDDSVMNAQPNRKLETYAYLQQEAYNRYAEEERRKAQAQVQEPSQE